MPIIDYHCHLPPADIAGDRRFETITGIWLGGDHYKWRAMRTNGVEERLITGDADPWEKFLAWAETVPATSGTRSTTGPTWSWRGVSALPNSCATRARARDLPALQQRAPGTGFHRPAAGPAHEGGVVCTTDDPPTPWNTTAVRRRLGHSGSSRRGGRTRSFVSTNPKVQRLGRRAGAKSGVRIKSSTR